MNKSAIGTSWEDARKRLFTPEEIAASDLRVAIVGEIIRARHEHGISQKRLEELSGVKQPIIARLEKGLTNPQLDTVLKLLVPLGKTLVITDLKPDFESKAANNFLLHEQPEKFGDNKK